MRSRLLGLLAGTAALALTAAAAQAADLPARTAPVAPVAMVPVFTWTGFYVGAQVGYQFSDRETNYNGYLFEFDGDNDFNDVFDTDEDDAFVAGAHAGYNFQFGSFVVGVEGDIEGVFGDDDDDYGTLLVRTTPTGPNLAYTIGANQLDWQGSIRARAGFAFDRTLVYATGGFAFGGVGGGHSFGGVLDDDDDTVSGYTVGLGVEHAFTNNLTARLEYRYTAFDEINTRFGNVEIDGDDFDFHTVRLGVSFKF
ncbi:MAG TPA: outer membrane protein [Microvirga sp.]|jgi:outer membrane immunogenic protein|nr:outer membrane protein [Microvirga sp.]